MILVMDFGTTLCNQESVSFANGIFWDMQWIRTSRFCTAAPISLLVSLILALRYPQYNDNISNCRMCQIVNKCLLSPKTRGK